MGGGGGSWAGGGGVGGGDGEGGGGVGAGVHGSQAGNRAVRRAVLGGECRRAPAGDGEDRGDLVNRQADMPVGLAARLATGMMTIAIRTDVPWPRPGSSGKRRQPWGRLPERRAGAARTLASCRAGSATKSTSAPRRRVSMSSIPASASSNLMTLGSITCCLLNPSRCSVRPPAPPHAEGVSGRAGPRSRGGRSGSRWCRWGRARRPRGPAGDPR